MSVERPSLECLYEKNKDLRKDDIEKIREWTNLQPHLPNIDEFQLIQFLHSCEYMVDYTKKCIENYFTIKNSCPEVFANRDPNDPFVLQAMRTMVMTPLPKQLPDGQSLVYSRLLDDNKDNMNFAAVIKTYDLAISLHLQEIGTSSGHVAVIDMQGYKLALVLKIDLSIVKNYMFYLQEAIPFRLLEIHFVNVMPILDMLMAMIKPFMKKELIEKFHVHKGDNETINNYIPKEYLPEECGGTCGPVKKMHDDYMEKVKANTAYFMQEENLRADDSKRVGKSKKGGGIFGNFKKSDVQ